MTLTIEQLNAQRTADDMLRNAETEVDEAHSALQCDRFRSGASYLAAKDRFEEAVRSFNKASREVAKAYRTHKVQ